MLAGAHTSLIPTRSPLAALAQQEQEQEHKTRLNELTSSPSVTVAIQRLMRFVAATAALLLCAAFVHVHAGDSEEKFDEREQARVRAFSPVPVQIR